jgi:hypothetical protein
VEPYGPVAEEYAGFAEDAAAVSPCFDDWARAVAGDEEVLGWLSTLPPVKRKPNLVFAAARWHGVAAPGPYAGLRAALLGDDGAIRGTILSRRTQTNEVGRLATLVPVLGRIEAEARRPLALVEAGASAGLCVHPDRHPRVAWRAGVDLHPLDVTDADAAAWLETLVWPEEHDRRDLLRRACAVSRSEPPDLRVGDLLDTLPDLVSEAAGHGQPVVFHSAVIAYLEPDDRRRFVALMTGLVAARACPWVSNEAPEVLPEVTAPGMGRPPGPAQFVLGLDGGALAWAHGHGRTLTWLDARPI